MREKHQDWEALLEKALAEECGVPANLLELVRQRNRAAVLPHYIHTQGAALAFVSVCASNALLFLQ